MTIEDSEPVQRSLVYELLARLWAQEPDGVLEQISEEPLSSAWRGLGGIVPDFTSDTVRASLEEEYCRLFIGPSGHLPPIQSVWMSGELDKGVRASLNDFDSVVDFAPPWKFITMPDHLGNELWAMAQILRKSVGLSNTDFRIADDLARQFFIGHLSWAEPLLNAAIDRERDGFYGTVASITLNFLRDESPLFRTAAVR